MSQALNVHQTVATSTECSVCVVCDTCMAPGACV